MNFLKFLRTPFSQNTSKFRNIHRKSPVLESLFNEPADILTDRGGSIYGLVPLIRGCINRHR